MKSTRAQILDWAEQGALPPDSVRAALELTRVTPDAAAWRKFVSALLLWLGVLLVAAGIVFFFAYNWDAMGRFTKFGLVEGLLAATVVAAFVAGTEKTAGKAALLLASLLTGALLALIGQTYQTGADPYELFAWWALLILPWALVARSPVFWLLIVALLNLTVGLYFQAFRGFFFFSFRAGTVVWALCILNALSLAVWEFAASRGSPWIQARWAIRIVALLSGFSVTTLALWLVFESDDIGPLGLPTYLLWLGAAYFWYRHRVRDLFVLAMGVLSVIVVVASFLGRHVVRGVDNAGGLLIVGMLVIVLSAAGGWWLKNIAAEDEAS